MRSVEIRIDKRPSRLQQMSLIAIASKIVGGACVVGLSFWVTLKLLDTTESIIADNGPSRGSAPASRTGSVATGSQSSAFGAKQEINRRLKNAARRLFAPAGLNFDRSPPSAKQSTGILVSPQYHRSFVNITPCPMNTSSSIVTPSQVCEWILQRAPTDAPP
jgi:hypothetical protein